MVRDQQRGVVVNVVRSTWHGGQCGEIGMATKEERERERRLERTR